MEKAIPLNMVSLYLNGYFGGDKEVLRWDVTAGKEEEENR